MKILRFGIALCLLQEPNTHLGLAYYQSVVVLALMSRASWLWVDGSTYYILEVSW